MKKWNIALVGACIAACIVVDANAASDTITIQQLEEMQWQDYPGLPGVKFVVVAGNPRVAGPYTIPQSVDSVSSGSTPA